LGYNINLSKTAIHHRIVYKELTVLAKNPFSGSLFWTSESKQAPKMG